MENVVSYTDLFNENAALKAEVSVLKAENAEISSKLSWLLEQLSSNQRKLYGSSSEKSVYDQIGIFGDKLADPFADSPASPEPGPSGATPPGRPKKHGEIGSRLPEGLPVETIEVELPEGELGCPKCGDPMRVIGKEVVRREVKITPASVTIIEYVRYSYSCPPCEGASGEPANIVKPELPPQLIKGSMCTPETAAHIAVEKCVMGTPIYRQEAQWKRDGIPFTRQTMGNWIVKCSEDYLAPIYDKLHKQLCQHKFLHSDSTTLQVLREPGKPPQSESQMWVYRTSGDAEHPIILYEYQPDKKQERPRDFLSGFKGYLHTDGSSSYNGLPDDIILVGCMSHARRDFSDALRAIKNEDDRAGSLALIGRQYCDDIFKVEREAKDKSFDERYEIRNKKAAPILGKFRAWLDSVQPYVAPKSKIGGAVNYTLNQWERLIRYLLDGRIECSNNRCERSVKPFVINRKNFLFSTSVSGARATAILHSFTETAKENNLDPFRYLTYVFKTAAGINLRENEDMLVSLLPENAPESCKVMK
ncbi:MAG: IS66 family transposase [Clostridiales bacterium]|nr:IS66 family transposase [Clostridiales bacterium]